MEDKEDRFRDINELLGGIFKPKSLKEYFENKIEELDLTMTAAQGIIGINYRSLNGILSGDKKTIDYTNLVKISIFLQLNIEEVIKLYVESLERNFSINTITPEKISFIKDNFNLPVLKKSGLISSVNDFEEIEKKLLLRLGLKSIFEYRKPSQDIAFSSGKFELKNEHIRSFWVKSVTTCLEDIGNDYGYNRDGLIKFFPQIRWFSTNIEEGFVDVIKHLYKLGITVIYYPSLQSLKLRGATFSLNHKPCIIITNYYGFYATLWFALIHELYHVLFDFEDIKRNTYHLTDDSNDQQSVLEREKLADNFAREYLYSRENMRKIEKFLDDRNFIESHALENHVDPSLIYAFYAFDKGSNDRKSWARARKYSPEISRATSKIEIPWDASDSYENLIKKLKSKIYI